MQADLTADDDGMRTAARDDQRGSAAQAEIGRRKTNTVRKIQKEECCSCVFGAQPSMMETPKQNKTPHKGGEVGERE